MADEQTTVLVVGAGLAGCAAAAFLARGGIDVVLLERRPSPSIHPRVVGQSVRTMELLRMAGMADGIPTSDTEADGSPARPGTATQPELERILLAHAEKAGAAIRFSTEVVNVTQDAGGVTARLLNRWNERLTTIRADYLVAADGHRSTIRERLGIRRHGEGALRHRVAVVFDVPDRRVIEFDYHPGRGESILDFTTDRVTGLVRAALDDPELAVDVQSVQAWEIGTSVADRFRDRRVLLAGDAARTVPPNGTIAGDAAIGDAYDIAWKLAEVLSGAAEPALLDSYQAERQPFAERVASGDADPATLAFDLRCRSAAVLVEDGDPTEDAATPSGRPGSRAPHVPLVRDGAAISTIDLFGDAWTLLTGAAGGLWHNAAEHVGHALGVRIVSYGLGPHLTDDDGQLATCYGIGEGGASLVRPDGVVAWRCGYEASDPALTLSGVMRALLGRTRTVTAA